MKSKPKLSRPEGPVPLHAWFQFLGSVAYLQIVSFISIFVIHWRQKTDYIVDQCKLSRGGPCRAGPQGVHKYWDTQTIEKKLRLMWLKDPKTYVSSSVESFSPSNAAEIASKSPGTWSWVQHPVAFFAPLPARRPYHWKECFTFWEIQLETVVLVWCYDGPEVADNCRRVSSNSAVVQIPHIEFRIEGVSKGKCIEGKCQEPQRVSLLYRPSPKNKNEDFR